METLFEAIVDDFDVMPHPRLVHGKIAQKLDERTQRYFINRDELAWRIRELQKGVRLKISVPVKMAGAFHVTHGRRCDLDNVEKTIQDALMEAGVITDDSLIEAHDTRLFKKASRGLVILRLVELEAAPTGEI